MADNKISIELHERGKKHKEMAQKRIIEARKKGAQEIHDKDEVKRQLAALEKAAMKAYEQDRVSDPSLPSAYRHRRAPASAGSSRAAMSGDHLATVQDATASTSGPSQWAAFTSEEGYVYYHNYATGETTWEKPTGFVDTGVDSSISEAQAETTDNAVSSSTDDTSQETTQDTASNAAQTAGNDDQAAFEDSKSEAKEDGDESVDEEGKRKSEKNDKKPDEEEGKESAAKSNRKRPWSGSGRDCVFGGWQTVAISTQTMSAISDSSSTRNPIKTETPEASEPTTDKAEFSDGDEAEYNELFKFGEKTVPSLAQSDTGGDTAVMFKKRKRAGGNRRKRTDDD